MCDLQVSTLDTLSGATPRETARMIIRKIMSQGLALQTSLTDLGEKRVRNKISFEDHAIAKPVFGESIYNQILQKLLFKVIMMSLTYIF